jgi:hypothetical protein
VPGEQSAGAWRTVCGCLADSPRAPRGRSVFQGSLLEVLLALMDSPRPRSDGPPYLCGQSAVPWWTVRLARADSPPLLAGRSARAWLFCSLVRFLPSFRLSCFRVCFKESFLRLEVDPQPCCLGGWCDSIHRSCVTGICLGYRPGSLRRIFTGSYSLPPLSSRHPILQGHRIVTSCMPNQSIPRITSRSFDSTTISLAQKSAPMIFRLTLGHIYKAFISPLVI